VRAANRRCLDHVAPSTASAPVRRRTGAGLYLVATPIGNLRDITLRALDILSGADMVLAEDTRVTAKLMNAYGLSKKLERYDEHAAERAAPKILRALADGARVALVSDAGTPMVSDPGFRLARDALAQGSSVFRRPAPRLSWRPWPWPGFRQTCSCSPAFRRPRAPPDGHSFESLGNVPATLVFFEGASRVSASLQDMAAVFGNRDAAVARELTKLYETVVRSPWATWPPIPTLQTPRVNSLFW